jgi:hypothetical protein
LVCMSSLKTESWRLSWPLACIICHFFLPASSSQLNPALVQTCAALTCHRKLGARPSRTHHVQG